MAVSSLHMDQEPRSRPSLTPPIAMVAVGAAAFVVALAPGMTKFPMFAVSFALIAAGSFGIASIARHGVRPEDEPTRFSSELRMWTILVAAGVIAFLLGWLAQQGVVVLAGATLLVLGAGGVLVTAFRHRAH